MSTIRWYWAVVVVLVAVVWFGAPERADAQIQNAHYRIRVQHSDKCLDVQNAWVSNGARLQQWDCNPSVLQNNQLFNLVPVGTDTYRIFAVNSVKCLDIESASTSNGALLQQYDCNTQSAQANQVMLLQASGIGDYYYIKPTHSGKCLDVSNVSYANGAAIQQWDCANGQSNQLWRLDYVGNRTPRTHIQTFGYFDAADPLTIWNHANLTDAYDLEQDLAAVLSYGEKAKIPTTRHVGFFKGGHKSTYPQGSSFMEDGWQGRWCEIVKRIMGTQTCDGPYYPGHIAFFYLDDEPYWNNSSSGHAGNRGWTLNEVHDGLQTAAAAIKAKFPNVPVVIVEAFPMLGTMLSPSNVDWVGFDCYGPWANCEGTSIPNHLLTLKARLHAHQKIILVPWAAHEISKPFDANAMHDAANRYVELALSDPQIVALALWKFNSDPAWTGTSDLSSGLYTRWQFLGRALGFGFGPQ